jgi:hypothetical protein
MHRKQRSVAAFGSVLAAAAIAFAVQVLSSTPAYAVTFTGCLTEEGELKHVAEGLSPLKPCDAEATQVTWGGGPKTVFVTSQTFHGDLRTQGGALTGLRGGDEICQAAAENGIVPPGTYIAWLSTSVKDAIDRLPANTSGYFLPSGRKVADSKSDVVSRTDLVDPANQPFRSGRVIDEDELGGVGILGAVWTGTHSDGRASAATCNDWTVGGAGGWVSVAEYGVWRRGITGQPRGYVLDCGPGAAFEARIYCFQR